MVSWALPGDCHAPAGLAMLAMTPKLFSRDSCLWSGRGQLEAASPEERLKRVDLKKIRGSILFWLEAVSGRNGDKARIAKPADEEGRDGRGGDGWWFMSMRSLPG